MRIALRRPAFVIAAAFAVIAALLGVRAGPAQAATTGTAANGTASLGVMGICNQTGSGNGGSAGTVFVDHNGYMINVYWTNKGQYGDNASCMEPEGGTGSSSFVYLDLPTGDGCAAWSSD